MSGVAIIQEIQYHYNITNVLLKAPEMNFAVMKCLKTGEVYLL